MRTTIQAILASTALLLRPAFGAEAPRPAVVELFTSEGCSSCPPAEAYVGELARRPDVLALAFHVDYWDELGWRDRFGLAEAVQRQRGYARSLRLSSVYTPQAVIDGRGDFVGADRAAIDKALAGSRSGVPLTLARRDGDILIDVGEFAGLARCDVLLVAYQRSALSAIGRGENAGRTLAEFNIVRALRNVGPWDGHARPYRVAVDSLPRDATDIAVLVQTAGYGPIVGAAAVALR